MQLGWIGLQNVALLQVSGPPEGIQAGWLSALVRCWVIIVTARKMCFLRWDGGCEVWGAGTLTATVSYCECFVTVMTVQWFCGQCWRFLYIRACLGLNQLWASLGFSLIMSDCPLVLSQMFYLFKKMWIYAPQQQHLTGYFMHLQT